MKKALTLVLLGIFVAAGAGFAKEVKWLDNFDKALEKAESQNRYVLVNFSGSDWCRWCIKLSDEVFEKEPFQTYAEKNLVLFVADFPRQKVMDPEIKEQNQKLAQKYGIRGFPTVLLFSPEGKMVAQTGYRPGGAEDYVEHLKELIEKHKTGESSE